MYPKHFCYPPRPTQIASHISSGLSIKSSSLFSLLRSFVPGLWLVEICVQAVVPFQRCWHNSTRIQTQVLIYTEALCIFNVHGLIHKSASECRFPFFSFLKIQEWHVWWGIKRELRDELFTRENNILFHRKWQFLEIQRRVYRACLNTGKEENKNEINEWLWNKKNISDTYIIGLLFSEVRR